MTVTGARRVASTVAVAIGVGLALAPAAFGMFSRAPGGGRMLDGFRPFMNADTISGFQSHLATIGAAADEAPSDPALGAVASFREAWPRINDDMGSMLATMGDNLDNFAAVDALPPFGLFPYFFVVPGLFLAGAAIWYLRSGRAAARNAVAAVAVGLIAAPFMFQMFARAPLGGEMIDDFRPFMTEQKVQTVQGYFLVIGAGEGELRTTVLAGSAPGERPAAEALAAEWPRISNEMAPMIGAMSDNVANFQGVAAMPPFPLFPWFFVIPGVVVLGLLAVTRQRRPVSLPVPSTALMLVAVLLLAACGGGDDNGAGNGGDGGPYGAGEGSAGLVGVFQIDPGSCAEGGVEAGSWFRMVQSGGTADAGPFVPNGDSTCADKTWTPLSPGADGGLRTGGFQPQAEPPFDGAGNATSADIIVPVKFFAVAFGLATNEVDPQTGQTTINPTVINAGGTLFGDVSAIAASWNGQHFNQGTPKPGSQGSERQSTLRGTYDVDTKRYTLSWTSLIEGGPFNGFTGVWHLEGTFAPAG